LPRQSNGTYVAPSNTSAVSGQTISSSAYNSLQTDLGNEITNSLDRGGRGAMTANFNVGGYQINNLANPSLSTDAANKAYADLMVPLAGGTMTGVLNCASNGLNVGSGQLLVSSGNVYSSGNITAYYTSDRKFKENIKNIPEALAKVRAISGVTFDWSDEWIKANGGEDGYHIRKRDAGVIAQEINNVLPEAVARREDGSLAVKYEKIISVLIEAIKELDEKVRKLEVR